MHIIFIPFSPCWVMGLGQMPKSQAVVVASGQSISAWARKALPSLSASAREMALGDHLLVWSVEGLPLHSPPTLT